MNAEKWRQWKEAPPGSLKKRRLLNELAKENEGLIRTFVNRCLWASRVRLPQEDAMQAGYVGFMAAIERWDPSRAKFSTMAWYWIRAEVQECLGKEAPIRRPPNAGMPYLTHRKADAVETAFGREVTGADLGVTEEQLAKWRSVIFHFIPVDEIRENQSESSPKDQAPHSVASDEASAEESLIQAEVDAQVARAFRAMSEEERTVLLLGKRTKPYKEVLTKFVETYHLLEADGRWPMADDPHKSGHEP